MAGKGKIKLQDAVDDYDWIRCVTCRKVFPKREYIQHRREAHQKERVNNNNRAPSGTDPSSKAQGPSATSSSVARRRRKDKREILIVTLSSDEDDGVNNDDDDRSGQYSYDEATVPVESSNSVSRHEGGHISTETCSQSANVFIVEEDDEKNDGRDSEELSDRRSDTFVTNSAENHNGNSEPEIVTIDDDEDSVDHYTGALSPIVPDQVMDNEDSDKTVAAILPPPVTYAETQRVGVTMEEQNKAVTSRPTVIRVSKKSAVEGNKELSREVADKLVDSSSFRDTNCYEKENSNHSSYKEHEAVEPEEDINSTNLGDHPRKLKLDFKRDRRKQKRRAVKMIEGSDGSEVNGNSHRKENLLTEPAKGMKKRKRHLEELATVSELQSNKTDCFKNPKKSAAQKAINRRQYCVKNVTDICEETPLEKRRVVVVLGRLREDKPVTTKEVRKFQLVHRDNDSPSVPRKTRKPRQPPVPLIQDIQPYVRRAAASKPIRYEEHFCPYCHKVFTHYKVAETHIKKHEDNLAKSKQPLSVAAQRSKPPPIVRSCSASTTDILPLTPEVLKPRRKRCNHCRLWLDETQMLAHMKLHTKSKRFKCKNCKKGFASLSGKRQHENKCRQFSLVFLPNGEWRQVPVKAPGGSSVTASLYPPICKRRIVKRINKSASGIRNGFRSSRRAKGRTQKTEVAKTAGNQTLSNQKTDDLVNEPPKATVREPPNEKRHEVTATGTKKRAANEPGPSVLLPKLAKSDLLADYSSPVGKRIISLLSQLDETKATLARREIPPANDKLTSNRSCWIVKLREKKSISCSLLTRPTESTKNSAGNKDNTSACVPPAKYSGAEEGIKCHFCNDKLPRVDYLHHVLQHEDCTATTCPVCLKIFLHSGLYYRHMKTLHGLEHSQEITPEEDTKKSSVVHCHSPQTCSSTSNSSKCISYRKINTNGELSTKDVPEKCSNGHHDSIINYSDDSHNNINSRCKLLCNQSLHWKKTFVKLSSCNT